MQSSCDELAKVHLKGILAGYMSLNSVVKARVRFYMWGCNWCWSSLQSYSEAKRFKCTFFNVFCWSFLRKRNKYKQINITPKTTFSFVYYHLTWFCSIEYLNVSKIANCNKTIGTRRKANNYFKYEVKQVEVSNT